MHLKQNKAVEPTDGEPMHKLLHWVRQKEHKEMSTEGEMICHKERSLSTDATCLHC